MRRRFITDLEYETTHPGAGRQHQEDVREEHEVTLTLLLTNRRKFNNERNCESVNAIVMQKSSGVILFNTQ